MAQIDNLPPLRDVLRKHDLIAKKSLGQNFLLDLNLTLKIAKSAGNLENVHVIEVGPGPGGLTRAILAAGAKHVTVIERDSRCLEALREISTHYPGRMTIIEDDALKVDMASLIPAGSEAKIIANLPYNVATPLLIGWLRQEPWPPFYSSLTLMFQKEVADRICANASDKQYGRLAVLSSWRTYATSLFDLDPRNFTPPPKVTSSVVHLEPRKAPLPCDPDVLEEVTAAAFQQRRKMLRASLKSLGVDTTALIEVAELSPEQRAETVPMEGFVALANALTSVRTSS